MPVRRGHALHLQHQQDPEERAVIVEADTTWH